MDTCQRDYGTKIGLKSEGVRGYVEWSKMGIHTISLDLMFILTFHETLPSVAKISVVNHADLLPILF